MSYRVQLAELDFGNLLFQDKAPLELPRVHVSREQQLRDIAEECANHFFTLFWTLPTNTKDSVTITQLPKPTFRLPREKRIPAQRDLTRWERFAKVKGIKNKKRSRKAWDPEKGSWRPRWGKDRIDDVKDKWVIEVPDNADPYEDQFAKLISEKNERHAKNELQRLRNIARVKAGRAPPVGMLSESTGSKNKFTKALAIAKVSDASVGRFTAPLDERKIFKKTEQKVKRRLQLSQVVGAIKPKHSTKKRNEAKKQKKGKKKSHH